MATVNCVIFKRSGFGLWLLPLWACMLNCVFSASRVRAELAGMRVDFMFAETPRAGLVRRLGVLLYDFMTLIALLMLAMLLALALVAGLEKAGLLSLVGYQDAAEYIQRHALWFQLYLLVWVLWFYLYFWCKAGQTLGMRAWRLLLVQQNGAPVTLKQALIRLFTSLGGLGNLWLLVRWKQKLALQDQLSGTMVLVLSKEQSQQLNLHRQAR